MRSFILAVVVVLGLTLVAGAATNVQVNQGGVAVNVNQHPSSNVDVAVGHPYGYPPRAYPLYYPAPVYPAYVYPYAYPGYSAYPRYYPYAYPAGPYCPPRHHEPEHHEHHEHH